MTAESEQFRKFGPDDTEAVVAVFRSNIPKYFVPEEEAGLREHLAKAAGEYYIAKVCGEVVAAGGIALNEDGTVSLCWGMVRADQIGSGLGKRLAEFRIERACRVYGRRPIVISTSQHTAGFYKKLGFRMIEHIPDGFAPGIDICKMRCGELAVEKPETKE